MILRGNNDHVWELASQSRSVLIGNKIGITVATGDTSSILLPEQNQEEEWVVVAEGGPRWESLRTSTLVNITRKSPLVYEVNSGRSVFSFTHNPRLLAFSPSDLVAGLRTSRLIWKVGPFPKIDFFPIRQNAFFRFDRTEGTLSVDEKILPFRVSRSPYPTHFEMPSLLASSVVLRFISGRDVHFSAGTSASPAAFFWDKGMVFFLPKLK